MTAAALTRPLSPLQAALAVAGVSAAVALYCVGYAALSGQSESLFSAGGWALANVAPWLVALEALKRRRDWQVSLAILAAAAVASVLLGALLLDTAINGFELWRRVPALAAVALVAFAMARLRTKREADDAAAADLPLPTARIDWVQAAGNYVELKSGDRTILHRTTLSAAERALADHGFVRIHRSILVRRDRIERVRTLDVVLSDGTHLKIGKRFRAKLAA
jgi:DNA-binding LytR/AlgR family response regulator